MISISLSIAPHHPQVNPFPCLFPHIYTPSTQPDVLRRAYHVSATRNFRLAPIRTPPSLRDLSPLIPTNPYASPPICVPRHTPSRLARRASERSEGARQTGDVDSPLASLVPRHPKRERESPTCARAARSFVAASVLAALVLRRRRRSWGVSCRAAVVKGSVLACFT